MKTVKLMVVGFGNIGRGFIQSLIDKKVKFQENGLKIQVVAVCEVKGAVIEETGISLRRLLEGSLEWQSLKTLDVIRDTKADIMVELTPGKIKTGEPGLKHMLTALDSGKHVVTSNKSPLVVGYEQIMDAARKNNRMFRFEATVGGAIPIINTFERELKSNDVKNIYGILNGTTNYILTKMADEGLDFASALAQAQELGYAEADPGYDIKGIDSAAKVVIIANSLLGLKLHIDDLKIEGIERITPDAIEIAKKHGFVIKLIGDIKSKEVSPRLVNIEHPLNVGGSLNAILVETDLAEDITIIGHGAGPKQTSSALLSDIMKIIEINF